MVRREGSNFVAGCDGGFELNEGVMGQDYI
jgi:hypothetical protein